MKTQKFPASIAFAFLWLGFVCAISFMEAWLKFKAPGLDLATGLQIGRLVFKALNIVEWLLVILIMTSLVSHSFLSKRILVVFFIVITILAAQTFWLLPSLDQRALDIVSGQTPASSNLHFYYLVFEILKVTGLIILSILIHQFNGRAYQSLM